MELSSPKLKNSLYFRRNFKNKSKKTKKITFFACWERTFQTQGLKKKVSKEAKFSKLKYFPIIIIIHFFSFFDFFSILNKLLFFILW